MDQCATPCKSLPIDVAPPRLCGTVEGVEFWIAVPEGRPVRCVITEAALQSHYGADDRQKTWMTAFLRHHRDIERRAKAAAGRSSDVHVVMVNDSTGQLKTCAGRCRS